MFPIAPRVEEWFSVLPSAGNGVPPFFEHKPFVDELVVDIHREDIEHRETAVYKLIFIGRLVLHAVEFSGCTKL